MPETRHRFKPLHLTLYTTCLSLTLLLSVFYLTGARPLEFFNLKTFDLVQKSLSLPPPLQEVTIVEIDDNSLRRYGQWPWPRYRLGQLLEKVNQSAPAAVGLNILFAEKDRTSPAVWQDSLKKDLGITIESSIIPEKVYDHDVYLAEVLADGPFVLSYEFLFGTQQPNEFKCTLHPVNVSSQGTKLDDLLEIYKADNVLCNYEPLSNSVPGSGFLNGAPDIDGIVRRLPLLISHDKNYYPSFSLALLIKAMRHNLVIADQGDFKTHFLYLYDKKISVDYHSEITLAPYVADAGEKISAELVMTDQFSPELFKDKIVLVGLTATGLNHFFRTIVSPQTSLIELHRHAIHSLCAELQTIREPFFRYSETIACFLFTVGLLFCILRYHWYVSVSYCLAGMGIGWMASVVAYQMSGYLFSPLLISVSLIANCCLLLMIKFHYSQREAKIQAGQALMQLKNSETSLRSILNTIPDIVFRLDSKGKIVYLSPAISKYVNSPKLLLGRSIFDLVAPQDLDKAQFRLNERRTGSRATHDLEIRLLLPGENESRSDFRRFFSVSSQGIYEDAPSEQSFLGTQGIVKDITDRRKLEQQLLQAQKMEVVGNLAAGIAHDLNNILSGLVSYPELLLKDLSVDDPLYGKIQVIQRSGIKAAAIVQDLLTLARRKADTSKVCSLNTIINDYLHSIEFSQFKETYPDVALEVELQEGLPNVRGSAPHLSKIVMNILLNGYEATTLDGRISISTSNVCLEEPYVGYEVIAPGHYVCAQFSDNGMGISEDDLNRIFEPFFTKKTLGRSGTGLGMSVIWATVKDHHGYIDIESTSGVGTVITFYLPATDQQEIYDTATSSIDDFRGSEKILVVDDIAEQLEIADSLLSSLGYQVERATNGEQAVEIVRKTSFDLVILDMIMPGGIDGLETYRQMREINPGQRALIVSGYSESNQVVELQRLGGGSFVQKPYSIEALARAVREELARDPGVQ